MGYRCGPSRQVVATGSVSGPGVSKQNCTQTLWKQRNPLTAVIPSKITVWSITNSSTSRSRLRQKLTLILTIWWQNDAWWMFPTVSRRCLQMWSKPVEFFPSVHSSWSLFNCGSAVFVFLSFLFQDGKIMKLVFVKGLCNIISLQRRYLGRFMKRWYESCFPFHEKHH